MLKFLPVNCGDPDQMLCFAYNLSLHCLPTCMSKNLDSVLILVRYMLKLETVTVEILRYRTSNEYPFTHNMYVF